MFYFLVVKTDCDAGHHGNGLVAENQVIECNEKVLHEIHLDSIRKFVQC